MSSLVCLCSTQKYPFGQSFEGDYMSLPICDNEKDVLNYFSNQLSKSELVRVEAHIAECPTCCETLTHLIALLNADITEEEQAFLDTNLERSSKEISEIVKKAVTEKATDEIATNITSLTNHLNKEASSTLKNENSTKNAGSTSEIKPIKQETKNQEKPLNYQAAQIPQTPKNFFSAWKTSQLALAASLAIIFLAGIILIYQLNTSTTNIDPLVSESLAAVQEINLKGRPTKLRFSELEFSEENKTRGNNLEEIENKLKASRLTLETLIENNPTPTNRQILAQVLVISEDYEKAIEQLTEASKEDKNNQSILNDLALCYAAEENYSLALETLNKALSINEEYLPAIFNRALVYQELKQNDKAKAEWERYLQLDSNSPWSNEAKKQLEDIK